jgi:probable F420-dependent oxidoreductase
MRFGISTFVTDEGMAPGPLAAAVEERGFDSLIVTEHSHMPVAGGPSQSTAGEVPREFHRMLDPFVALASAAANTERLALVTGVVLLPQRDVIYTAKEAASLDLVSNGRFALGVGIGWNRLEMRHHGVDPASRGAKLNEQIRALREIWTNDVAEFHGEYVDFAPLYSWPKPVQRPHLPIYVGGDSSAAIQRLRMLGDGWIPPAGVATEKIRQVRQWLADDGRANVSVTIWGVGRGKDTLAGYAQAGVDEVAFALPTLPSSATMRELDELAVLANSLA